jgi:hypothetical protein
MKPMEAALKGSGEIGFTIVSITISLVAVFLPVLLMGGVVGELLNDTMLVVWNRAASYNGHCKVSTWVFAIAYRKAMKALARWDEPVEDDGSDDCVPLETGPEQRLAQAQLGRRLAPWRLSAERRAVVALTYRTALAIAKSPDRRLPGRHQ